MEKGRHQKRKFSGGIDLRDTITGLYMRDSFICAVKGALRDRCACRERKTAAILYFNIRRFKMYNMHYGFEAGSQCLVKIGEILKEEFQTELVGRFSDDHYVLYTEQEDIKDIIPIVERVHQRVYSMSEPMRLRMDAGIYPMRTEVSVSQSLDFAKMACDSIAGDATRCWAWYSEAIIEEQEFYKYILDHMESALRDGQIKLYYQPLIRTLSGKLCGVEVLTRWDDPERGLLLPGRYIPVLEESNLIHRLDMYVIEQVGLYLKMLKEAGKEIVPVSLNLSRLDFMMADPYQKVLEVVEKYRLLREWISVEVTESAITEDPETLRYEISQFQKGGFEVWMDDFGSGYSSLNALKDYPVDEIKLDMLFLQNFDERSKRILSSMVSMAKNLGIHTLAEGVETEEQLHFLKEIGCEKIQGYFYSIPLPYEKLVEELTARGIQWECRAEKALYEKAGSIDFLTDRSLALLLDNTKSLDILFMNSHFWNKEGASFSEIQKETEHIFNGEDSFLRGSIRALSERAKASGAWENMDYAYDGRYYRLSLLLVGKSKAEAIFQASLTDITFNENKEQASRYNIITRGLLNLYDTVALIDYGEKRIEGYLFRENRRSYESLSFLDNPVEWIEKLENVLPEELPAFRLFFEREFSIQSVRGNEGRVTAYFSIREVSGDFRRTEVTLCLYNLQDKEQILVLKRRVNTFPKQRFPEGSTVSAPVRTDMEELRRNDSRWKDLMSNTDIYFFWKDKERRFLGASKSFLDYYSFSSMEDILGKTDEEIKWHIDDSYFRLDEEQILEKGVSIHNAPGQNLIGGVIHNIFATKFPTYTDGKVNGLMGYFIDAEKLVPTESEVRQASFVDASTGLMNTRGFMMGLVQYEDNYRISGEEYWLVILEVLAYRSIHRDYGSRVAEDMAAEVAEILKEHYPVGAAISRISRECFTILEKNTSPELLEEQSQRCIRDITGIHSIDGYRCTLYVNRNIMQGSSYSSGAHIMELIYSREEKQ